VVAKVRERLAVNEQRSQGCHIERFSLKKLNEVEAKEKYCFEVSNRYSALEDFDTEVEINNILAGRLHAGIEELVEEVIARQTLVQHLNTLTVVLIWLSKQHTTVERGLVFSVWSSLKLYTQGH
jgi:hypothetical protein